MIKSKKTIIISTIVIIGAMIFLYLGGVFGNKGILDIPKKAI